MKAIVVVDFEIDGFVNSQEDIAKIVETMVHTGNTICVNQYYRIKTENVYVKRIMTDEEFAELLMKE